MAESTESTSQNTQTESSPISEQAKAKAVQAGETVEVAGTQIVDFLKGLLHEGNVNRIIIRQKNGKELVNVTLTTGVFATGILTLLLPALVGIGVVGLFVARFTVDIVRTEEPEAEAPASDILVVDPPETISAPDESSGAPAKASAISVPSAETDPVAAEPITPVADVPLVDPPASPPTPGVGLSTDKPGL